MTNLSANSKNKTSQPSPNQQWGGRFSEGTDQFVQQFTESVSYDQRLAFYDIAGSIAHATMLQTVDVLSAADLAQIQQGLTKIKQQIAAGTMQWRLDLEDVHMNIESALTQDIGDAGKRLHTGRSRNDQVATDIRLYVREMIYLIQQEILRLQQGLLTLAKAEANTIMPGFTHLQVAQPVTFGHHLMAWFCMLQRDVSRFTDCSERLNWCPLGAAALAGTTYPIDRHQTAALLGFNGPTSNSIDSVSDRDFAIEFCHAASLTAMHLSRFSEELVWWSSTPFHFVDLPDRFCTGSSIMPQKKNPDIPELVRGKTGRIYGNLIALLTLMKSQPLAYNRDNQEDKEPIFDSVDTLLGCLHVFADMIPHIQPCRERMHAAAQEGFATATDLADYLVRKGIPFRDAHEIVGKAVKIALDQGVDLAGLSLSDLQQLSSIISDDVFQYLTLEGSIAARNHVGGTAPEQVHASIEQGQRWLDQQKSTLICFPLSN